MRWALLTITIYQVAAAAPTIVAKIDEKPIYISDLDKFKAPRESKKETLDRVILYRLAVEEAKRQNLQETPEVQAELDRALYKAFLDQSKVKANNQNRNIERELRTHYKTKPMLRLRHLVLAANTSKKKKTALKNIARIEKELTQGKPFKTLVLKYSQDTGARFAGDLDYRGYPNLPAEIYQAAKRLKKGDTSKPIFLNGAFHLVELLDKQKYSKIPATYRSYLRSDLERLNNRKVLTSALSKLKSKSKIITYEDRLGE